MNHQHHAHGHNHCHGDSLNSAEHFSKLAPTYNELIQTKYRDLFLAVTRSLAALGPADGVNWDKNSTHVLDYACGGGLVTKAIAGRVKEVIGIDHAEGMVKVFNEEMEKDNLTHCRAHVGDLDTTLPSAELSGPNFHNFNLIICSAAYHHITDLPLITKRLVERLAPNGVLVVLDRRPGQISDRVKAENTIVHDGFTDQYMVELFEGAGLGKVEVKVCEVKEEEKPVIDGLEGGEMHWPEIFVALGRKL